MTSLSSEIFGVASTPTHAPVVTTRNHTQDLKRALGLEDRFSPIAKIGEGGNAEVYKCVDEQTDQTLALKRLRGAKTNRKTDWDRFINEPTLMNRIQHPVIPTVYDIFPERMYKPYFTMELIDGIDLCRVLSGLRSETTSIKQAFPLDRLIHVLLDVCDGLAAAHENGVIHRDIKPENIMLTSDGKTKLVDWGVSIAIDAQDSPERPDEPQSNNERRERRLTRCDQRIGSPLYMSPEQVNRVDMLDGRTDVYSLGVVLYDCLSLTTMITSTTLPCIFDEIVNGTPERPSRRTRRASVPSNLEAVCMKAVSANPDDRYPTVQLMADALQSCLAETVSRS